MGVYHKWGSNANGRPAIFDVSHDFVKKVVPERKQCFWPAMENVLFSLPKNIKNMIYGLVKK